MTVTASQVADKVREIGEREPDVDYYVRYQEFAPGDDVDYQYALGDGPGCIVGKALYELGIEIEILKELDSKPGGTKSSDIPQSIIEKDDDRAVRFLRNTQLNQDSGYTWGEAVADAEEELN